MSKKITKFCVTCEQDGHTYLECPEVSFLDMFMGSINMPNLMTGESANELKVRVSGEYSEMKRKKDIRKLNESK